MVMTNDRDYHRVRLAAQGKVGLEVGDCFPPDENEEMMQILDLGSDPVIRDRMIAPGSDTPRIMLILMTTERVPRVADSQHSGTSYLYMGGEGKMAKEHGILGCSRPDSHVPPRQPAKG